MNPISKACLVLILFSTCIPTPSIAQTENATELHQYLEIPFESTTPDAVSQILQKETGEGNPTNMDFIKLRISAIHGIYR